MATTARRGKPKIKPPRKHIVEPSVDDIWAQLSQNIREIHAHNAFRLSFEENHRFAYNIVLARKGQMLYDGVCALINENLDRLSKEEVMPAFPSSSSSDLVEQSDERTLLLKAMRHVWDDHYENMSRLRDILKYMDRVYTKQASVPEIMDKGMHLFLSRLLQPPVKPHVLQAILAEIATERAGLVIHRSNVKAVVDVLLALSDPSVQDGPSVYTRDLEPVLLDESREFYTVEGARLLSTCPAPEYLSRVEARLASEDDRAAHYLSSQTAPALRQIVYDTLLTPNLRAVLDMPDSGLDAMIDHDRTEDLSRLYRLFSLVPEGLATLRRALKYTVTERGKRINEGDLGAGVSDTMIKEEVVAEATSSVITGKGKPKPKPVPQGAGAQTLKLALKWVEEVLILKDKFERVLRGAFGGDRELESGINEAFESFVNTNDKSPEFISLFIDDHLKKGLKGKSDTEVEQILDKTITIFRFISDKDVFERYYKNHLAKRLLHGRSASDDAERGMLAKLKVECGFAFTQKLEGMFHDMRLSSDTNAAFRSYLIKAQAQGTPPPDIDIAVTVMTSTFWPMAHTASPAQMPTVLVGASETFEKFYLARHTGRRLTWQPALGNVDVRVAFKNKTHDLNVATYALVILLLFENLGSDDFLTYEEISNGTAIPEAELQRHLQSLACAKFKVLKKHPPGRDVHKSDSFSFNADFSAPLQKIKISTIAARVEDADERKETNDRVEEERKHQMDACVVRIMKDRKHMTHSDLVNEVIRQLTSRFHPDPGQIKKRVESLIEREYLERCEDRKSYNYMA